MKPKQQVRLRIESRSGKEVIVQEALGLLYPKGDHFYIRYDEAEAEMGRTITMVKLENGQARIIRQGDVQSEQTFVPGEKRLGFYQTSQGKLTLEVHTHSYANDLQDGPGTAAWSYDLYVAGEHAGRYQIKLSIQIQEGN
jgi:uncharacterized beta-barrel protein YwiB (DUF1934 family)